MKPRKHPLPRSQKRIKRSPIKKGKGKSRFPKRREPEYLAWIRTQACVVTGKRTGEVTVRNADRGPNVLWSSRWMGSVTVVPAHNPSRGAGGYDRDALPLDSVLHAEQHRIGIISFCEKYNLSWAGEVVKHRALYTESNG